jgi:muconolactone delta-isomerase
MLYHLDVDLDYGRMGSERERLRRLEWERTRQLFEQGVVVTEYLKASARGVVVLWDCPSHDAVRDTLMSMPLYPYFHDIRVTPLVAHPAFAPDELRRAPVPVNPFQLDADIDYGRLGEDRDRLLATEWARSKLLREQKIMLGIARKANGRGVIAFWDCPSHEALREHLVAMPLYPYFSDVRVTPLTVHPIFRDH